jgi:hypothetical protein
MQIGAAMDTLRPKKKSAPLLKLGPTADRRGTLNADAQGNVVAMLPLHETPVPPLASTSEHIEAIVIFTMVRFDLLKHNLESIDYPTKRVFVVFNYANEAIKHQTIAVLKRFGGANLLPLPHKGPDAMLNIL